MQFISQTDGLLSGKYWNNGVTVYIVKMSTVDILMLGQYQSP